MIYLRAALDPLSPGMREGCLIEAYATLEGSVGAFEFRLRKASGTRQEMQTETVFRYADNLLN